MARSAPPAGFPAQPPVEKAFLCISGLKNVSGGSNFASCYSIQTIKLKHFSLEMPKLLGQILEILGHLSLLLLATRIVLYSHPGQLSLAIPPWGGAMSTSQRAVMLSGWGVDRYGLCVVCFCVGGRYKCVIP